VVGERAEEQPGGRTDSGGKEPAGEPPGERRSEDETQPLMVVRRPPGEETFWTGRFALQPAEPQPSGKRPSAPRAHPVRRPNPLLAAWRDPDRRLWLALGCASLLAVLALIAVGPSLGQRFAPAEPAAETPGETVEPGAQPQAPPAVPPEAQPPPPSEEGTPPEAAPAAPAPGMFGVPFVQLGLQALPLLLGLFWLLSAWLVDTEARRAFVVQEPWGERRTVAYSCLAVGCVFPLILAGLLFSAWGFVSFVIWVANRASWMAGIQAGALLLLIVALFLIVRGAISRWLAERRYNPP
jgi:hypothetical protein